MLGRSICKVYFTNAAFHKGGIVKIIDTTLVKLLIKAVLRPECLATLDDLQWEKILQLGRLHGISGRWFEQLENQGLISRLPPSVVNHLWSDQLIGLENERMVRWEADRVQHALAKLNIKFVLLKGAAYVLLGLSPGNKRVASDVDILVPFNRLDEVEAAFKENGWHLKAEDTYDERYYREWMHELPPLQHNVRGAWLDVYHNIVPRTSRLCPDASSLLEGAIVVSGTKYLALCPADMAIHSILHGFYGGEFLSAFRDILDVHELLTDLPAAHPTFWADFTRRVAALKIERSVFYALRYAMLFFDTRVPENTLEILATAAPNPITLALMDFAIGRMVIGGPRTTHSERLAAQLLLARSHWIKMPPLMLFKHLSHKFAKRRAIQAESS